MVWQLYIITNSFSGSQKVGPRLFLRQFSLRQENVVKVIWKPWSSCSQMFFKMVFLKISQYLQEDTCVGVIFLIKLQAWRPCNFIEKSLQHTCFPINTAKFSRTAFFIEPFRWLLLLENSITFYKAPPCNMADTLDNGSIRLTRVTNLHSQLQYNERI